MTEELQEAAWKAEDEGHEVYVQRHEETGVIEYLEVDGREIYNPDYLDEVRDAYWAEDAYRVADHYWRN